MTSRTRGSRRSPDRRSIARIGLAIGVAATGLWIGAQALGAGASDAAALGARSREVLGTGDLPAATALARHALRRDPTVVAAVQTLGLAAQARGDRARADRLLAYADRLSRRDLQTHLWAIERDVARGDTDAALREYDLALRTSPAARDLLFPVLGGAVADPAIAHAFLRRLAAAPAWRGDFLFFMATERRVLPAQAVRFLASARAVGASAAPGDVATLAARAVIAGDFATAWGAYRLIRPGADVRRVRDPGFAALSESPAPFDWNPSTDGGIVARSATEAGRGGLEVEAEPGTAGIVVDQMQMLPAGRYRLEVDAGAVSDGGELVWSLACRNGPELARIALPGGPARRYAAPAFAVPDTCRVQQLGLAADASASGDALRGEIRRVVLGPATR